MRNRRPWGWPRTTSPPASQRVLLSSISGASAIRDIMEGEALTGPLSAHDRIVGETLIHVLTRWRDARSARLADEDAIMALEREAFIALLSTSATMDRVRHTLETGKPLRN
jgi:3-hydroxyacyl-CoA dehydrogenase